MKVKKKLSHLGSPPVYYWQGGDNSLSLARNVPIWLMWGNLKVAYETHLC